jgi:hypothetical protein
MLESFDLPTQVTFVRLFPVCSTDGGSEVLSCYISVVGYIVDCNTRMEIHVVLDCPLCILFEDNIVSVIIFIPTKWLSYTLMQVINFLVTLDNYSGPVVTWLKVGDVVFGSVIISSILDKALIKIVEECPKQHSFVMILFSN